METASTSIEMWLRLCGDPALFVEQRRIPVGRKAMALLAYMAVEPGPHGRAQLSSLLWPEADETHAAMSLRQALARLREVLGDRLHADRSHVALLNDHPTPLVSDYARFRTLVESAPLDASMYDVHRFLSDLATDNALDYSHWVDRTRAQLTRQAIGALARCSAEQAARRDWGSVDRAARRWLVFDPLSVDATCRVIESACMRRAFTDAQQQRDAFVALARAEDVLHPPDVQRMDDMLRRLSLLVGSTPAVASRAIATTANAKRAERLPRASEPQNGAVGLGAAPPLAPFVPPLLERETAWAALTEAGARVSRQRVAVRVCIAGGVGSGRSRLAQDFAAWASRSGAAVLSAASPRTIAAMPYQMLSSLLRSVVDAPALAGIDGQHLRTLSILVPELAERFPALRRAADAHASDDASFPWRLQEALWQSLNALADEQLVAVLVDDVMRADRESALVIESTLQRTVTLPILWVFTTLDQRSDESTHRLWSDVVQGAQLVALAPLTAHAIEGMLATHYGVTDGWAPLASRLHAVSHGVAGDVCAAVECLRERHGDIVSTLQQASVAVPPLASVLQRRIEELDEVSEATLLSLALLMEDGHPIPAEAWRTRPALTLEQCSLVHGISRLRAAMIGQRLVAAQLAVESEQGYRCVSPAVVDHMIRRSSALLVNELRRLL